MPLRMLNCSKKNVKLYFQILNKMVPLTVEDERIDKKFCDKNIAKVYEIKKVKDVIPQVHAALTLCLYSMMGGIVLSFSGILIPEIEKPDSNIQSTISNNSWIASVHYIAMVLWNPIAGVLVDSIGRLNTIRLSIIPSIAGWVLIATGSNTTMLIIGKAIIGVGTAMSSCSAGIYIAETTWPTMRGVLLGVNIITSSIGIELVYLQGFVMKWRTMAWSYILFHLIITCLTFLIHESPVWLINNGKTKSARKSLEWLHKHQTSQTDQNLADIHLAILIYEDDARKKNQSKGKILQLISTLSKPNAYKPFLIITLIITTQQFSGYYIIEANAVSFFTSVGSNIDPLLSSNLVTTLPIVISIINLYTIKRFPRKKILISSSIGSAVCLFISGIFTKWINDGTCNQKWVPVLSIVLFMAIAMAGWEPIPWIMLAELVPQELRGVIMSSMMATGTCIVFLAVYSYRFMENLMGIFLLQLFYGFVALLGSIIVYFILPETHGKTLTEIEQIFKK